MMSAAQKLHEQYQRELRQLQETCPHAQITDWIEEWWAPGHDTGREVRTCTNCEKFVQARRQCRKCGNPFLENELIEGDGRALPMGGWYCAACHVAALSGIETGESHR